MTTILENYIFYAYADYFGPEYGTDDVSGILNSYYGSQGKGGSILADYKNRVQTTLSAAGEQNINDFEGAYSLFNDKNGQFYNLLNSAFEEGYAAELKALSSANSGKTDPGDANVIDAEALEEAGQVISGFEKFLEDLQVVCNQCADFMGEKYEDFRKDVIEQYMGKGQTELSGEAAIAIINSVLHSEQIISLHDGQNRGENASKRLVALFEALEVYKSLEGHDNGQSNLEGFSKRTTRNKELVKMNSESEILEVLYGKVRGSFANVKGDIGEIAAKHGLKVALDAVLTECSKVEDSTKVPDKIEVIKTGEDYKIDSSGEKHIAKADIEMIITKGEVSAVFGATVKNYTMPKNGGDTSLHLASNLSFLDAYDKAFPGDASHSFLYNLAGGHSGDARLAQNKGKKTTEAKLRKKWSNVVAVVTATNFLDALSGVAREGGEVNSIILILNGKMYPIEKILLNITQSAAKGRITKNEDSKQQLGKDALWDKNKFIHINGDSDWTNDKEKAAERNENAQKEIGDALTAARFYITLNSIKANILSLN